MFCHSLVSCWNNGNAHFLRGVAAELARRGHEVRAYEPEDAWSRVNLRKELGGKDASRLFRDTCPELRPHLYDRETLDLGEALDGADLVLVHEWNEPELVACIGKYRRQSGAGFVLLFHDTHHRGVTAPDSMARYDLSEYDGVLAFGAIIRDLYRERGWAANAWTWHEAADIRLFHPLSPPTKEGELVWVGNWGDEERTAELQEFLIGPTGRLGLQARVYGVRYPEQGIRELQEAGIRYGGWLPNVDVPRVFARYRVTVHVPRRPYVQALPGIPTIRVFEALACGLPLVSAPWEDAEGLFTPGKDFLFARNGAEMEGYLRALLAEPEAAEELAAHGLKTIQERHTCAHRVDELLAIYGEVGG